MGEGFTLFRVEEILGGATPATTPLHDKSQERNAVKSAADEWTK